MNPMRHMLASPPSGMPAICNGTQHTRRWAPTLTCTSITSSERSSSAVLARHCIIRHSIFLPHCPGCVVVKGSNAAEWRATTLARAGVSLRLKMPPDGLENDVTEFKLAGVALTSVQGLWLKRLIRSGPCRCM